MLEYPTSHKLPTTTMLEQTYWVLIKFSQTPRAAATSFRTWASRWVQYKGSRRLWSKKSGKYFATNWAARWRTTQIESCISRPWNKNSRRKDPHDANSSKLYLAHSNNKGLEQMLQRGSHILCLLFFRIWMKGRPMQKYFLMFTKYDTLTWKNNGLCLQE